jgi:hypothetical protein
VNQPKLALPPGEDAPQNPPALGPNGYALGWSRSGDEGVIKVSINLSLVNIMLSSH